MKNRSRHVGLFRQSGVYFLISTVAWQPSLLSARELGARASAINVLPNSLPVPLGSFDGATTIRTQDSLTVKQIEDRVKLDWSSFNIGDQAQVRFDQPKTTSVALNKIHDANPSQINGLLSANGIVYLVNHNGILFGPEATVNVASLVASTLDIDYEKWVKDKSYAAAIADKQAAFQGGSAADAEIKLENGARIATGEGGSVFVFAPQVTTETGSSIVTPGGQTVLAGAKDQVYLAASTDPDLRGMLVEVNQGGTVDHAGTIVAERGNITLAALAINQKGTLTATTSVDANGSIRLLARDTVSVNRFSASADNNNSDAAQLALGVLLADDKISAQMVQDKSNVPTALRTGSVVLHDGSVTQVVADTGSGKRATDVVSTAQNPVKNAGQPVSFVEVMGKTIDLNAGSTVSSRGGEVQLVATNRPSGPGAVNAAGMDTRVTLHAGSRIDVSGMDTARVAMERNSLAVELRGDELKDSPIQRDDQDIRGETVYVDLRKGDDIEFADISGYIAKLERTVDERLAAGGTVNIVSEGRVDFQQGAVVDLSGGAVNYDAGFIRESKLVSGGQLFNISEADPNRRYDAILNENERYNKRWDVVEKFRSPEIDAPRGTFVEGYVEGKDAGTLNIRAKALDDLGTVVADTVTGPYQRGPGKTVDGGSLSLDLGYFDNTAFAVNLVTDAVYQQFRDSVAAGESHAQDVSISVERFRNSVDNVTVKTRGSLTLDADAHLQMDGGGKLDLTGRYTDIQGDITNRAGAVTLAAKDVPTNLTELKVGPDAVINTSGRWVNDHVLASGNRRGVIDIDAGDIKLNSTGSLLVAIGAQFTANGGAWLDSKGAVSAGKGGDVSVTGGSGNEARIVFDYQGRATSHSLGKGGTFSLAAGGIDIGDGASTATNRFAVDPAFFSQGGFSTFALFATESGVDVAAGTVVNLAGEQLQWKNGDYFRAASAAGIADLVTVVGPQQQPEYRVPAVDLSLTSSQTGRNDFASQDGIRIGEGAVIQGRPGAAISLTATDGDIDIKGSIISRGGSVDMAVSGSTVRFDPSLSVRLHDTSLIDVGATVVDKALTPWGYRDRDYYSAGSVDIRVKQGYILGEEGSQILADGLATTATYYSAAKKAHVTDAVDLDAGQISLLASEGMLLDTRLSATAQRASGRDGSLNVTLSSRERVTADNPDLASFSNYPLEIRLGDYEGLVSGDLISSRNIRQTVANDGSLVNGIAYLDVDSVNAGGFGQIQLTTLQKDEVLPATQIGFASDKSLRASESISLRAPAIQVNGHAARIEAPYIRIGTDYTEAKEVKAGGALPVNGTFTADADFIDLTGQVVFRDADTVNLRSRGDIRLRGSLKNTDSRDFPTGKLTTYGDLNLIASQVYTTTQTDYTVDLTSAGSLFHVTNRASDFTGIADDYSVYSAAGTLTVNADHIVQAGVLKAPFGQINLNGRTDVALESGSVTSVSGEQQTVVFGQVDPDGAWVYPIKPVEPQVISALKEKSVSISSPAIEHKDGAAVNIEGGGELLGYAFTPGRGGSRDVLLYGDSSIAGAGESFAIVPNYGGRWAPYDTVEMRNFPYEIGSSVRFEGIAGLNPAMNYAILPARYALLSGAYLVTPTDAMISPGLGKTTSYGASIVAGKLGNAGSQQYDSLWSAFVVEPGSVAFNRSEYALYGASGFFSAAGSRPQDAGRVMYDAISRLNIDGQLLAGAAGNGVGGRLDIVGEDIAVVAQSSLASDRIELVASELSSLDVDSILLGGERILDANGTQLTVGASSVTVESDAELEVSELMLAAQDSVTVQSGAVVSATENGATSGGRLVVSGDGALVQVSVGEAVKVERSNSSGSTGQIDIQAGATLFGEGALVLDASRKTTVLGDINTHGTAGFSANRLILGADTSDTGMALSQAAISRLDAGSILLGSRGNIDVEADIQLDAEEILIDAPVIHAADGVSLVLNATNAVTLMNSSDQAGAVTSANGGVFELNTAKLNLVGGDADADARLRIAGFDDTNINATNQILASGALAVDIDGDASVATSRLTSAVGADLALGATGNLNIAASTSSAAAMTTDAASGFASRFSFSGDSVNLDTSVTAGSGVIAVEAVNGIHLGDLAQLDVAGRTFDFAGDKVSTDAGTISLRSANGDITTANGSRLDLSAPDAVTQNGTLILSAANGTVDLRSAPVLNRQTATAGGVVAVDVQDSANLASLMPHLAGFREAQSYRARNGNIAVAASDRIQAESIVMTADQGAIQVDGFLDATAFGKGSIELYARDNVSLGSTASLVARSTGFDQDGGEISLSSRDGFVNLAEGASLDVSGGDAGGVVSLYVGRNDSNTDIKVNDGGADIVGADSVRLIGMKTYETPVVNQALLDGAIKADTASFMAAVQNQGVGYARLQQLADQLGSVLEIMPGIEIHSEGDLRVEGEIDLAAVLRDPGMTDESNPLDGEEVYIDDWRYGDSRTPGYLRLAAEQDLFVAGGISDGFVNTSIYEYFGAVEYAALQSHPIGERSWSLDLVGGADRDSASFRDVVAGAGNIELGANAVVRTGTGDIRMSSGGDIQVADGASIYTGGRSTYVDSGYGLQPESGSIDLGFGFSGLLQHVRDDNGFIENNRAFFSFDGGDIDIRSGGSVQVAGAAVPHTHWLYRIERIQNDPIDGSERVQSFWGLDYDNFVNGVGALGGGSVNVAAAGDIHQLTVAVPTTGMPTGATEVNTQGTTVEQVLVRDGGDIRVTAGGNVVGGHYLVSDGRLDVIADGSLDASIAYGKSDIALRARDNLEVRGVIDQNLMPLSLAQDNISSPETGRNYGFYDREADSLTVRSYSGDVVFNPDATELNPYLRESALTTGDSSLFRLLPAQLDAVAFDRDILFRKEIQIEANEDSSLRLYAGSDILSKTSGKTLLMSGFAGAMPYRGSSIVDVSLGTSDIPAQLGLFDPTLLSETTVVNSPLFTGSDDLIRLVTLNGDIAAERTAGEPVVYLPREAEVIAGRDIRNINMLITNTDAADVSRVSAGRDIVAVTARDSSGVIDTSGTGALIKVAGPGTLLVTAGRDVNLGASGGIVSSGDRNNPSLPNDGANILLLAGVSNPDFAAFAQQYILGSDERSALSSFIGAAFNGLTLDVDTLQELTGVTVPAEILRDLPVTVPDQLQAVLSAADTKAMTDSKRLFLSLSRQDQILVSRALYESSNERQRQVLAYNTLLNETKRGGLEGGNPASVAAYNAGLDGYVRSEKAIDTLFSPDSQQAGDISLVFSTINTLDGGDIGILAPGGGVDVGLPVNLPGFNKKAEQLGIIVTRTGDLDVMARNDVSVNQSRTFALDGDIMMWSTTGDIDAGRGSKTAAGLATPTISVDETGKVVVDFAAVIAGSGIRGANDVYLFAPAGIIDAGEAGIGAQGNLTLAAQQVVGADNIDVGGVSIGVPTNTGVSSGVMAAGSMSSAATGAAAGEMVDQAEGEGDSAQQVAFLTVEIIGLGD